MVNEDVRNAIRTVLKAYHDAQDKLTKGWLKTCLTWHVKYLEMFIMTALVSEEAQKTTPGVDLSKCRRDQQGTMMRDPKRDIFKYEHTYPIAQMREKLIEVSDPRRGVSEDQIITDLEKELAKFDIIWLLKEEDHKLNVNGYRYYRPENPLDAYEDSGIKLLPRDGDGQI